MTTPNQQLNQNTPENVERDLELVLDAVRDLTPTLALANDVRGGTTRATARPGR